MEFVDGESLAEAISRRPTPLRASVAFDTVRAAALAVEVLEQAVDRIEAAQTR